MSTADANVRPFVPAEAGVQSRSETVSNEETSGRLRGTAKPLAALEANKLFAPFAKEKTLVVAVSGGPDSTALLWLLARWRKSRKIAPTILAVTVDHGLRAEAAREASAVGKLARSLGVGHRILHWRGRKPKTGVQEAARNARYALLAEAAKKADARYVLTAHTLDDQAETVMLRLFRGSGLTGLQAMTPISPYPGEPKLALARPLLSIPKARLIATVSNAGLSFANDPSNRDPRHTRVRVRALMPALRQEGLTAPRLALLARRLQRSEAALRSVTEQAAEQVSLNPWSEARVVFDRGRFFGLPAEIGLRLLGQAVGRVGDEGPVELGKLEALFEAIQPGGKSVRRTLAGAMVTLQPEKLVVERAPRRRQRAPKRPSRRISALTTRKTAVR